MAQLIQKNSPSFIVHFDGDSFFTSIEQSMNPALKGRPVVTGAERGIASAMSTEAKELGITRGMPIYRIRRRWPQVVVAHSDYRLYTTFAERMYTIARRYYQELEEYSIDEFFTRPTPDTTLSQAQETAHRVKRAINSQLGVTVSVGLAPTKVLAKLASARSKPNGFLTIEPGQITSYLKTTPLTSVWGIGSQTATKLQTHHINTAQELVDRPLNWIQSNLTKPTQDIWYELQGRTVLNFGSRHPTERSSITSSRSLVPTTDKPVLTREMIDHLEKNCFKLRRLGLVAQEITIWLKTQDFRMISERIIPEQPIRSTNKVGSLIEPAFNRLYAGTEKYRTVGVTLSRLLPENRLSGDLFQTTADSQDLLRVIDSLNRRFGSQALRPAAALDSPSNRPPARPSIHLGKRLTIPYLGQVN